MYKELKKKKWKFLGGGSNPITSIDPTKYSIEQFAALKAKQAEGNAATLAGLQTTTTPITTPTSEATEKAKADALAYAEEQRLAEKAKAQGILPSSSFSASDYLAGVGQLGQSLNNARLDDGKVTGDEIGSSLLDTGAAMSGPYGQAANALITVGEGLVGDKAYQGMGEGVEYEKGFSRAGKGALKGAALGAKVGGPLGALGGAAVGGVVGVLGQGRLKRQAKEEFEKRRDERILNMNQQSKNIYADQYQSYYRKGGKAVSSYLKLK